MYRCVAASVAGFVQQVAVCYLRDGYFFYVTGIIPLWKNPERTDGKIISEYGLDLSRFARSRRRRKGIASVQYLRYRHFFVLMATEGAHPFFLRERDIRDIRRDPLQFGGYSIGWGKERGREIWHPSVRIEKRWMQKIKRYFRWAATRKTDVELIAQLRALPFEPFAPVRQQVRTVLREVNRRRRAGNLSEINADLVDRLRRQLKPFAGDGC